MTNIEEEVREVVRDTPGPDVVPAWETVTTRGRRIARRRRMGRAAVALGVVGATVLGIVYVIGSGDTSSRSIVANPGPGQATTTTPVDGSSNNDASVIPPGQYRYVKVTGTWTATTVYAPDVTYTALVPRTYEFWIGADDSGRIRTDDGDPTFLTPENEQAFNDAGLTGPAALPEHSNRPLGPGDMHSLDLSTLPVDEAALRDALNKRAYTDPADADYAEQLFERLIDNIWMTYGPTRNSRALISVLGSTPGLNTRTADDMTIVSVNKDGIRKEIWFDSATGEIRRLREVIVDATIPYKLLAPNGTVLEDATLEVARLVPSTEDTATTQSGSDTRITPTREVPDCQSGGVPCDPGDGELQLTEKVVVAEGDDGAEHWQLEVYQSSSGYCSDLRIGAVAAGGCFTVPMTEAVNPGTSGTRGAKSWSHGPVRRDVAIVRLELSDGQVLNITPVGQSAAFPVNFYVSPVPPDITVAKVTAFDADGNKISS